MTNIDLENILLDSHSISTVNPGSCCYSDEIVCTCKWRGDPTDYGKHLLVTLGLHRAVLDSWYYRSTTIEPISNRQEQEYLNIFRGPKDMVSKKDLKALDT